jgi:hypothetical protein
MLVYALDRREPEKRERAREVIRRVGGVRELPEAVTIGRTRHVVGHDMAGGFYRRVCRRAHPSIDSC